MTLDGVSGFCLRAAAVPALGLALCLLSGQGPASTSAQDKASQPTPVPAAQSATWADKARTFSELEWITRPSRDAVMSFTIPVEVRDLPVKPGDRVKKGDVLIGARDGDAAAAVDTQRIRVANTGPIDAAKAALDSAQTRYDRIMEADKEKATNRQEVDDRRVQLAAARAQLLNAQNEQKEEVARLKQLEEALARYRLEAPFDGVVDSVLIDAGSSIEPPNPVLRIVNIDTLWIDLPTPTELTLSRCLKRGDAAWVMLDVPGHPIIESRVLYVSPVADAAAATRRVRVEVPNPGQLPPGTRARVRFDKPEGFTSTQVAPRRGVLAHPGAPADHDLSNCVVCAKAAWEAIQNGDDPVEAVRRAAAGKAAGMGGGVGAGVKK